MIRRQPLAALLACAVLAPVGLGQVDLLDTVCFGDSLTHNDLLGLVYGNPQDMYGVDPMQAVFDKGAQVGDDLDSYAVGGSESDDVSIQVDLYLLNRLLGQADAATLFCFEIGANDILNNDPLLAAHPPGVDPAADAVIDDLIENIDDNLTKLWLTGSGADFVVWTIPDVTTTPNLAHLGPEEAQNVRAHIERANAFIRSLEALPFVSVLDLYGLLQRMVAQPPYIYGHQLVTSPAFGNYNHIFADDLHLTAVVNARVANQIIINVNAKWGDQIPAYTLPEQAWLARIPHFR
jgi:hypothetical protein